MKTTEDILNELQVYKYIDMVEEATIGIKKSEIPKMEVPENSKIFKMSEFTERDSNPKATYGLGACSFVVAEYNDKTSIAYHEPHIHTPSFNVANEKLLSDIPNLKKIHILSQNEDTIKDFLDYYKAFNIPQEIMDISYYRYNTNALFDNGKIIQDVKIIENDNLKLNKLNNRNYTAIGNKIQDILQNHFPELESLSEVSFIYEESFFKKSKKILDENPENEHLKTMISLFYSIHNEDNKDFGLNKIEELKNNPTLENIAMLEVFRDFIKREEIEKEHPNSNDYLIKLNAILPEYDYEKLRDKAQQQILEEKKSDSGFLQSPSLEVGDSRGEQKTKVKFLSKTKKQVNLENFKQTPFERVASLSTEILSKLKSLEAESLLELKNLNMRSK